MEPGRDDREEGLVAEMKAVDIRGPLWSPVVTTGKSNAFPTPLVSVYVAAMYYSRGFPLSDLPVA